MKESFGTPSLLPCSPSFSSSFCPIASFAQTTTEAKCVDSPYKTSGDAPRQSMRADYLAVSGKTPNKAWQETSILYPRATKERLSGRISLKCTLGQPVLSEMAYYVRFKQGKRCRTVHFANISGRKARLSCPRVQNMRILPLFGTRSHRRSLVPCHRRSLAPSHCRNLAPIAIAEEKQQTKKAPRGLSLLCLWI